MSVKVYTVYHRTDDGAEVIATIAGDRVVGPKAEGVERTLREMGWPAKAPDRILCGDYVWAAVERRPSPPK